MGQILCCLKINKNTIFHTDIGNTLIQFLLPKLDDNAIVITFRLKAINGLDSSSTQRDVLNPYIEMKLKVFYSFVQLDIVILI